jgi:hypothetical protein
MFGEHALNHWSTKRRATIQCKSACTFLVLNKEDFEATVKQIKLKQSEDKIKFLRTTPFFTKWSRTMLLNSISIIKEETFYKGKVVVREGEQNPNFFLIKDGTVTL